MHPSPSLAELQRWMRWVLTHPLGVDRALSGEPDPELPRRFIEPRASALGTIAGEGRGGRTRGDRLSVYASGYFSRLHGTLEIEYPRLAAALGPESFRALSAAHLLRQPSTSASLADLGAGLAATLEDSLLGEAWCVDLSLVERALAEVWLSDAGPFATLTPPPGRDWAEVRLEPSPALRLLQLAWDVDHWEPGDPAPAPLEHALVIWRADGSTGVERLAPGPASLLRALVRGLTLGEACGGAEAAGLDAETMTALFAEWAGNGWFARTLAEEPFPSRADGPPRQRTGSADPSS